jgi:beta-galactosidase
VCKKNVFLCVVSILIVPSLYGQNVQSLAGEWQVSLDTSNELYQKHPDECIMKGMIKLPGSLAGRGYGYKTKGSDFGILTPEFKYIGKALYSRKISIPKDWEDKNIEIFLERVLWESCVFIDGHEISQQDGLGTPHRHALGKLAPGSYELTIQIDNSMIHNIGDKGHAYGDYTQSIWNGMVGRLEMSAFGPVRMTSCKTFPKLSLDEVEVKTSIEAELNTQAKLHYEIISLSSGKSILMGEKELDLSMGTNELSFNMLAKGKLKLWSEFHPEVYVLKMNIKTTEYSDESETEFGYQEVSHDGTKVLINGKPVFLRGNLDCVHFPLTGYPSCDVKDWERIFNIYKEYGLNHARFHSWCPPEAAFKAANRVGIYLQAEASIWIDWWMSEDMTLKGRPEMDTKGHPKGLGYDERRDTFVIAEMNRVVETYGNHPSFTMFCIGNELGNSDFDVMKKWVADLKEKDPRRLYAVSTARTITNVDDYCATHFIQKVGRTRGLNGPSTDWDFENVYSKIKIPIIAHEIGQWPVYPKWSEIGKYTGVLKARNFEEFKLQAEKNGIADQSEDFAKASGALNQIMYKYETESFLRTSSCAGIQLLSMQDYQGQGEALIGWLNAHWQSKGITTPAKFKEHFNTTVPLLRMEKFVWSNDEIFSAKAQLSHHGNQPLNVACNWEIRRENGQVILNGSFKKQTFNLGSLSDLGDIRFDLAQIKRAEKLTVSIKVENSEFRNQWDIWVYPSPGSVINLSNILITDRLNAKAESALKNGGKVLLIAHELGNDVNAVKAQFYPLYWSLTFFPGQGKTSIGLLLKDQHPAFKDFPTSSHSDWQWETISDDAKGFMLNEFPESYKPIAQPVDDFHRNNKVGSIFELKVGEGSILVCGYNLEANIPVARQLKKSLIKYMMTPEFEPTLNVDYTWLAKNMTAIPIAPNANIAKEFEHAILYVDAAANLNKTGKSIPWNKELDEVKIMENTSYQLKADGMWKDKSGSAWHGKQMRLQIKCPEGILGELYVHFHDWNTNDRAGVIEFEGRKVKLEKHDGDGQWVKFHVMREDSNDGKLLLKTTCTSGPNLMITKVVLVNE